MCGKLRQIIEIVEEETAEVPQVILTSSWKDIDPEDEDYKYMIDKLKGFRAEPAGATKEYDNNSLKTRWESCIDVPL